MTALDPDPGVALLDPLDASHRVARSAIDGGEILVAVTWLSAHLAAVDHTLYREAARVLPDGAEQVAAERDVGHVLQYRVWLLDRRLTGDVASSRLGLHDLLDDVVEALDRHEAGEHRLVHALADVLDEDRLRTLAATYAVALTHAPTRPHPFGSHHAALRGAAYRLDAMVDGVRDALDNRRTPTRRQPVPPQPPGRWGMYVLGIAQVPLRPDAGPRDPG